MIKKFLVKAKSLKPKLITDTVSAEYAGQPLGEGDCAVIDFGTHLVGKVSLKLSYIGSPPDAPVFVRLKFCEHKSEIGEDTSDYHGWISKSWIQEEFVHIDDIPSTVRLPRRYAVRYIKIDVISISSKFRLVLEGASVDATTSACQNVALCGRDDRAKKIDEVALRTLRNCMQCEFEDGPKRDRRLWLGDLRLQALANYKTYKNYDLVKRCLYLFAGASDKNGNIPACVFTRPRVIPDDTFMFDYSLLFIPTLLDYYAETGDKSTALDLLPLALRQIEIAKESFDEDVVRDSDKLGWCFIDWSLELNKQCSAQGVYIYCEKCAAKLCTLLEKDASELYDDVKKKTDAAISAFFDEKLGLFASGKDRQLSYASNIWMCLSGVFDEEKCRDILINLEKTDSIRPVTPYLYHHYIQALTDCGELSKAEKMMYDYWGGMVEAGADTFWELYDPKNPNASPYGSRSVNSYCHAWSCTPSYFIRKYFSGDKND